MAVNAKPRRRYPKLVFGETLTVAIETFRVSKVKFILTSLGMVIGTASLILVVTIGLTGKQYLLQQIQNIVFGGAAGNAGVASPPCTKQGPFTFGGETTQYPHLNARSGG